MASGTVSLQRMVSDGLSLLSCSFDAAALLGSGLLFGQQAQHRVCVSLCLCETCLPQAVLRLWVNVIRAPALLFPFSPLPLKAGSVSVLSK